MTAWSLPATRTPPAPTTGVQPTARARAPLGAEPDLPGPPALCSVLNGVNAPRLGPEPAAHTARCARVTACEPRTDDTCEHEEPHKDGAASRELEKVFSSPFIGNTFSQKHDIIYKYTGERLLVKNLKLKLSSKMHLQNPRPGRRGGLRVSQEALVCMFLEAASIARTLAMRSWGGDGGLGSGTEPGGAGEEVAGGHG